MEELYNPYNQPVCVYEGETFLNQYGKLTTTTKANAKLIVKTFIRKTSANSIEYFIQKSAYIGDRRLVFGQGEYNSKEVELAKSQIEVMTRGLSRKVGLSKTRTVSTRYWSKEFITTVDFYE